MASRLALLAAGLIVTAGLATPPSGSAAANRCPAAEAVTALSGPARAKQPPLGAPTESAPGTYNTRLRPTPLGWPVQDHWCVWIEPAGSAIGQADPGSAEGQRAIQWQNAVRAALEQWQTLLSITLVEHPDQAQVRLWRRRPPLQRQADGRIRASHGRAVLQLLQVRRGGREHLEPRVEVLLSPGQRALALQATALHELGHAFGLWGHSDDAADAMAAVPGAMPVLRLSPRDRATMRWLLRQGDRLQMPAGPAQSRAAAPRPAQAPTAD